MEKYLSPEDVCGILPGFTPGFLNDLRYKGGGPPYIKPTPRKVLYPEAGLIAWLKEREVNPDGKRDRREEEQGRRVG